MPFCIVADRSEPPEHRIQSASAKGWDVFDDAPARARFFDDAEEFEPEPGTRSGEPDSLSGNTDVLAWESSANDVNTSETRVISSKVSHVAVNRNVGPMLTENCHGEVGLLTEGDSFKAGCSVRVGCVVESKAEASNAGKEIENAVRAGVRHSSSSGSGSAYPAATSRAM